jgi:primase C-terminal domain protein
MDIRELASYIPTEDFREQNKWLYIANVFKAAGLGEEEFDEWCRLDPEKYGEDAIARYRSLTPTESPEYAINRLLVEARKYGYTYQGKFDQLPSVVLTPCYRTINKPVDEELPPFEEEKARTDAIRILTQIGRKFMLANYVDEGLIKPRIRPKQEDSYYLEMSDFPAAFEKLEKLWVGCAFQLNAVDSQRLQDEREAGIAKGVKKEHIISYDWCLIESDVGTVEEQWKKILSLDLPLLAVVHSGNKSLHCYCHVGAKTLEEYDRRTAMLMKYCEVNGFAVDSATRNINRWVRFPYAKRGGKMQYPVKVCEQYRTFNQWRKDAVYYLDIFDRKVIKRGNETETELELNLSSMMRVLTENGFRRNKAGDSFFRLEGKLVHQSSDGEIQTFLYDWLKTYFPADVDVFARCKWEPTRLKMLDPIPDERHTDSEDECFFYFRNTVIKVTANGIEKVPYLPESRLVETKYHHPDDCSSFCLRTAMVKEKIPGLDGFINARQMIDHNIKLSDEEGDFARFVALICNEEEDRIKALKSALGYLMHRHKNPSQVKAIVLTDESLTDENGGTGKGLLFQALGQMRFCQSADMKTRERNRFFFSTVQRGCSIFHMDDVQKDFDFNYLFNALAGDMEVEGKGENRKVIPFAEAPKIYMSTNFAFKDMQKDSHKRRMAIYELHRKFNAHYQPKDEFKRNFFYDWDRAEWNRFYNFMLECSLTYMREGLLECEPKFAKQKALHAEFQNKEEMLEFFQSWESNGLIGKQISNSELEERWEREKGLYKPAMSLKRHLNRYCELQGYKIDSPRTAKVKSFIVTKPE